MNFLQFLGFTLAPSFTLGLVVFMARNWFLERLKNSIKYEYDLSLESFKSDLKKQNDKELEEIKSFLKRQSDINLEDYRFRIDIRKSLLNDLVTLSSNFIVKTREYIDLLNNFIIKTELDQRDLKAREDNYKKTLQDFGKVLTDITIIRYQLELLINNDDIYAEEILSSLIFIENWLRTELEENFVSVEPIDYKSDSYSKLSEQMKIFKESIKALRNSKTESL